MIEDIIIPLAVIAAAEFGDKTQISILLLSSRSKKTSSNPFGSRFSILDSRWNSHSSRKLD